MPLTAHFKLILSRQWQSHHPQEYCLFKAHSGPLETNILEPSFTVSTQQSVSMYVTFSICPLKEILVLVMSQPEQIKSTCDEPTKRNGQIL